MYPTRIQITVGDRLVAECIVETDREAYTLWSKWSLIRYKRNLPIGGASIYRADLERQWDVRVGSYVRN